MSEQIYFEDVKEGDSIPEQSTVVDPRQMFFFSAATYNGHRIHYDHAWATDVEGHPDVLVQGPLQAALMTKTITDWIGPGGRLVRISLQNRSSAFPGEALRFAGRIVARREANGLGLVDLEIRGLKGSDDVLMPGTATVCLPRRASAGAER
jgi:hydroxyacyl-ACP dehydratase HTD2-like protein with hotdog domain